MKSRDVVYRVSKIKSNRFDMKNPKNALVLLISICISTNAFAQELLTPESYGIYGYDGYTEKVFQTLLPFDARENDIIGYGRNKTFYLKAPSFNGESALCVTKGSLVYKQSNVNIWYLLCGQVKIPIHPTSYSMKVPESVCTQLDDLFYHATVTASQFPDNRMICDGVRYYFNSHGKLSSVHSPAEGTRTFRMVQMADSICYAVQHKEKAVLERQMAVCKELANAFKQEYPDRHFATEFSTLPRMKNEKMVWPCGISNKYLYLYEYYDHPVGTDTLEAFSKCYSDSLMTWSREVFFIDEHARIEVEFINSDTTDTDFWTNREYHYYFIRIPESLCKREIILSVLAIPEGNYRLDENLQWQPASP